MIGQVIDKYRVESDLDREPFGVVYKATDLQTQQAVELGIIDPSLTEYGNDLKEVLDHKHIISGITHKNIAKLLDFFIFEENYVLVREHIPSAQSLSKWISSNSHSIEEIGEVVFQVCDALKYANEQGVAYNYISPSIIKIDKDGNVKITNLGFSKLFRASYSGSDTIIESANFLSPEQIQELPADGRSDIYSLGILLYLLLTKTLPFPGKNFAKIIAQKITEVPESPEQANPRVPKMLSEVVMQALQPERESRFSDLGEFKERLATALKQSKRGATGRHVGQKFGNYEVTEILGHGAHSTVFKAIDLKSSKLVALKMLDFRLSMEDQFVKRFEREGIISEKLHHPNIVRIVEKFEHEEFFFLAIEYVDGVALDKLFENDEPLPFEKAYKIFKQICEAFAYVHTQGIVHRDIKPSNIMINPEGSIKILDFGIAKILDAASESLTKSPIGTPQYMSPEQCSTGEVDSRTDIYALGVLLYKMVAGKVPFESDKLHILLKKHITEKPAPPSSINPAIPDELDKVILKALRKEKEERFSNAEEMLAAFSTTMKPLMRTSYIGKTIGDYEIMSVGKRRGGMAETFIGKHKSGKGLVFIKMLQQDLSADEMFRKRFLREIDVLRKMDHANIVKTVDVVEEEDSVFLVMDLVVGKDLSQILEERKRFSPPQALPIFKQICNAIDYAHTQGVVHRDIKPANVMQDQSGKIIVLDFGIAKILDPGTATLTTMPIGTPAYMSPEQFMLDDITPQSDIYSLGILLYELLSGKKPFAGGPGKWRQKHLKEPPVPLAKRIRIHKKIDKIVLKAMAKKPRDRPPSVIKFRDDFEKVVQRYCVDKAEIDVKHTAKENVQAGETIEFEVMAPEGGLVKVEVQGLKEPIVLTESDSKPGEYVGNYTVKEDDEVEGGAVTALYDFAKPRRIDESGAVEEAEKATIIAKASSKEPLWIKKQDPDVLLNQAQGHFEKKRYRKALKLTDEIVRHFPAYKGKAANLQQLCKASLKKLYLRLAASCMAVLLAASALPIYQSFKNPIAYSVSPSPEDKENLVVKEEEALEFKVDASSKNRGELAYQWSLDGRTSNEAVGNTFLFAPGPYDSGVRTLALTITDAKGRTRSSEWNVKVTDAVPEIDFDMAAGTSHRVEAGEYFKIGINRINFAHPEKLSFAWQVDGTAYRQDKPGKQFSYKTEYRDTGAKKISLVVGGDILEEPLESVWTLDIVPVETLARVTVDPPAGSTVSLRKGKDKKTFIAKYTQKENAKINYLWKIDGNEISGAKSSQYSYKSTPQDKNPRELSVHISDDVGGKATEKWRLKFEEYNPLVMASWKPAKESISMKEGEKQSFSVSANHDWKEAISYEWLVDGTSKKRAREFTYEPAFDLVKKGAKPRKIEIQAVARDDRNHQLKTSWKLEVENRPVLDRPSPAPGALDIKGGETLIVKAPLKTLTGDKPDYEWVFDYGGETISRRGETFKYDIAWDRESDKNSTASLKLMTEVWPDGKQSWDWDITIWNKKYFNAPPVIEAFRATKTRIKESETITFSVDARDPDPGQKLRYEFSFEDEPRTTLPSAGNKYTYSTDYKTVMNAGRDKSVTRTLIVKVTDTDEIQKKTASQKKTITIENAGRPPRITDIQVNDRPPSERMEMDLEEPVVLKIAASDPDAFEGDQVSLEWKVNGKTESTKNQWQWKPPATGKYGFEITATDKSGKSDTKKWTLTIVSERVQLSEIFEKMKKAYETLDYGAMRALCLSNAYADVDSIRNAMQGSEVSGVRIEYGALRISGQRAAAPYVNTKFKYKGRWIDSPQQIQKEHRLRKQDGVWKFESLIE